MVEIIPKAPPKRPLWQNILFFLSLAAPIAAIAGYFVLDHYADQSGKGVKGLRAQIAQVKTPEEMSLENELFEAQDKINDFSGLLENHKYASKLFPFLGSICHPKVQFQSLDFVVSDSGFSVSFPALAESYEVLHQQLLILRSAESIQSFEMSDIGMGKEGGVTFSLSLNISPQIFQ